MGLLAWIIYAGHVHSNWVEFHTLAQKAMKVPVTHWCPGGLRSKTLRQRSTQHKLERSNQSIHSECWLTLNLFKKFPHSDTSLHSSLTGAAVPLVSMCLGITIPSSVITAVLPSRIKFSFHSDPFCFRLI